MKRLLHHTPIGVLEIISDSNALVKCKWIETSDYQQKDIIDSQNSDRIIAQTIKELDEYFSGNRSSFTVPYKLIGTDFQKSVWSELCKISYGETISYKRLAENIGLPKAIRAVASACRANPLCIIIPCHRVIGSNRKLTGYNGGLPIKKHLLDLESIPSPLFFDRKQV